MQVGTEFDIDTSKSVQQVENLRAKCKELEIEQQRLAKAGKDTTNVTKQLQAAQMQLMTATSKTSVATKQLATNAQDAANSTKKLEDSGKKTGSVFDNVDKKTGRAAASFTRFATGTSGVIGVMNKVTGIAGAFGAQFSLVGVAITVATTAAIALYEELTKLSSGQLAVNEAMGSYYENASKEVAVLDSLQRTTMNTNASTEDRKKALEEQIKLYPEYFGGLSIEKSSLEDLEKAYNAASLAARKKALQDAFSTKRIEVTKKIVDAEMELLKATEALEDGVGGFWGLFDAKLKEFGLSTADDFNNANKSIKTTKDEVEKTLTALDAAYDRQLEALEKKFGLTSKDLEEQSKATKARVEAQKAEDEANKAALAAAKKLREEELKRLEALKKEEEERRKLATSVAGYQKELGEIKKALDESKQGTEEQAQAIAELGARYIEVEAKLKAAQKTIEQYTKTTDNFAEFSLSNLKRALGDVNKLLEEVNTKDTAALEALGAQYLDLTNKIQEAEKAISSVTKINLTNNTLEAARINLGKVQLAAEIAANDIEAARMKALQSGLKSSEEIEKEYNERAKQSALNNVKAIAEARLEVLKIEKEELESLGKSTADVELQIEKTKGEIIKANVEIATSVKDNAKDTAEKMKTILEGVKGFTDVLSDFFSDIFSNISSEADRAVKVHEDAITRILENEEVTNTEQLEIEEERLRKANEMKKQAAEAEAVINQLRMASELGVAIAKATSAGAGIGSWITVAATLASFIAGLKAAKSASAQYFSEGTDYVQRKGAPKGVDTIPAYLTEGESVLTVEQTKNFKPVIKAIRSGQIPADYLNKAVVNFKKRSYNHDMLIPINSLPADFISYIKESRTSKGQGLTVNNDYSALKEVLREIASNNTSKHNGVTTTRTTRNMQTLLNRRKGALNG